MMGFGSKKFWGDLAKAVAPGVAGAFGGPAAAAGTATILGRIFQPNADDTTEEIERKERQLELYEEWVDMAAELEGDEDRTNEERHHVLWGQIEDDLTEFLDREPNAREIGVCFYNVLGDAKADFE